MVNSHAGIKVTHVSKRVPGVFMGLITNCEHFSNWVLLYKLSGVLANTDSSNASVNYTCFYGVIW